MLALGAVDERGVVVTELGHRLQLDEKTLLAEHVQAVEHFGRGQRLLAQGTVEVVGRVAIRVAAAQGLGVAVVVGPGVLGVAVVFGVEAVVGGGRGGGGGGGDGGRGGGGGGGGGGERGLGAAGQGGPDVAVVRRQVAYAECDCVQSALVARLLQCCARRSHVVVCFC